MSLSLRPATIISTSSRPSDEPTSLIVSMSSGRANRPFCRRAVPAGKLYRTRRLHSQHSCAANGKERAQLI